MAVADGMGGHAAGERASELVLATVSRYLLKELNFFNYRESASVVFGQVLRRSVSIAHQALKDDAAEHPNRSSMGTTLTMVLILWPKAYLVHVGDSRCYLVRQQEMSLLNARPYCRPAAFGLEGRSSVAGTIGSFREGELGRCKDR